MKHLYKLLSIIFLLPLYSIAQSNYQPGLVVTIKGDTIHGFIDYQNWDSNPSEVSFKAAANDRGRKKYTLSDISYFSVDGAVAYKKYAGKISMDQPNELHLSEGRDTIFRVDTVFLKVLQQGKNLALYSYSDNIKLRFYISEAPDYAPEELVFRLYYDTKAVSDNSGRTVYENEFAKQLFALANKYNTLDDHLSRMFQDPKYTKEYLESVVGRINNISDEEIKNKYTSHGKINLFVSAVAHISTITAGPDAPYTTAGGVSSTSTLPGFGLGVAFVPNAATGWVEFRLEAFYTKTQFRTSYQLNVSPYVPAKAAFDESAISIAPQVIFDVYNAANFKFFLGVGLVYFHSSFSNVYFGPKDPATITANFPSDPYLFMPNSNSFMLKGGFQIYKAWEIYFNFLTSAITTNGGYFSLNNTAKQVGIAYHFGR